MSLRALPADTSSDLTSSVIGTLTAVVGIATVEDVVPEPAAPVAPDVPVVPDVPDGAEHAARASAPAATAPMAHRRSVIGRSRRRRSIRQRQQACAPRCSLPETLLLGYRRPRACSDRLGRRVGPAHLDRPTTGAASGTEPMEPSNGAAPKANTPPSEATSQ